jgi:phytoene synthase
MTTPSSDAVQALMAFEINRAERLYQEAMVGIPLLPRSVQPAVRAAAAIYSEILAEIKRGGYTVPTDKIRFSALKKLYLILKYGYYKK